MTVEEGLDVSEVLGQGEGGEDEGELRKWRVFGERASTSSLLAQDCSRE